MDLDKKILKKIALYKPKGGLDHSTKLFLSLSSFGHTQVKEHSERMALILDLMALELKKDRKAFFFAGLLHDIGKLTLPHDLFDGRNITVEEYEIVKKHAIIGFQILKPMHLFIALCSGLHHNVYKLGYGISMKDFPKQVCAVTYKKVLETATALSIVDFIDAFTHRKTTIKDGSDAKAKSLKSMLVEKYPEDIILIEAALRAYKRAGL